MEYNTIDKKSIKSWRISAAIALGVILAVEVPVAILIEYFGWDSPWKWLVFGLMIMLAVYEVIELIVFPVWEYKQWGYAIEEDKVVIRHGIFFVKETVIPIIRIQNITISQGPINRKLGLYKVELFLASGIFEIVGLNQETADRISENLKSRLYRRISEKGDVL